ncbi:hypothetical protein NE850_23130 [Paraburkholderia sp. USG1]|uniref:hypothetical protein n=1 Tax=Paraburkholderia sp. USG1 TaxID=2952268 RepID=UPI00285B0BAA|nr:hypothetical protein [Paraburkholderia sp. USG1]MDR8399219.1 hypothetical protein [Paraburkholderia sp. USG1]
MTNYVAYVAGPPGTANLAFIDTAGTMLLKTGPGSLKGVSIDVPAASGTVTLYDGIDDTGKVIGVLDASVDVYLDYGCQFNTGLNVQVVGNPEVTISFF